MKHGLVLLSPRAALLIGAALLSTPALAQDATQTVTPPPVVTTAPPPVTPPPAVTTAPAAPAAEAPAPRAAEPRRTVTRTERSTTTRTTRAPAARAEPRQQAAQPAAAPAPAPAPVEPVAQQPAAPVAQPVPVDPIAPAPVTEPATAPAATQPAGLPTFAWVLLGLVVLAGLAIAALAMRRRSSTAYAEPLATTGPEPFVDTRPIEPRAPLRAEPVIAAAPVVAAPDAAIEVEETREPLHSETEAEIAQVRDEDLALVAEASAPEGHRPWIEFGLRPVRAGTSEEEALVEFELTVGNSGDQPARDVRITTFMVPEGSETEMEKLLLEHANDASVPPVTIGAGEGTRVDALVATPKGEDLPRTFNPLVVADARYRLPDGSEGRTAAAFRVGRHAPIGGLGGIGTSRPHIVEDLEAELEEVLERV